MKAGLLAQFTLGQGICGGSLISFSRVLTAAHCWFDGVNQADSFTVVLGTNAFFTGGTRFRTNEVVMHDQWTPSLIRNDVAIIKLPRNVNPSNLIGIIALSSGNENYAGETATASGFGITRDSNIGSNWQFLNYVDLPVITNLVCSLSFPNLIENSNICTSGANGKSTCRGDFGGPLTVQRNGHPLLIGVASFGSAHGCELGYPAVFSRVTSFITFINQNL